MKRLSFLPLLALLALCFLSVLYGAFAVHLNWWPSKIVADAKIAATALLSVQSEELGRNWPTSMEQIETSNYKKLTVVNHSPAPVNDLIFVDGGTHQLRSHCPENGCTAWIMDKQGNIRHVWDIGTELIWQDMEQIEGFSRAENIYSVGAHPFSNGDLLVTYQGRNTYPYGVGIAKFDKDSNLLWKKENFAHHWFSVDQNGFIYMAVFSPLNTPVRLGNTNLQIDCNEQKLQEDMVVVLDPSGEEIDRFSILQSFVDSGYGGLVFQAIHSDQPLPLTYHECDPTHLNDVRVISETDAATSPHLSAGDLLVSLRSINTVAVINRKTRRVTWVSAGHTSLQHSPRYMGDNTILVFDNLGGSADSGGSRIVRLDMSTDEMDIVYPNAGEINLPEFLSATAGYIGLSSDRKRALISATRQGRTIELDIATGQLLWEFLNIHDVTGIVENSMGSAQTYGRFATQTITYFNDADFPFNEGKLKAGRMTQ